MKKIFININSQKVAELRIQGCCAWLCGYLDNFQDEVATSNLPAPCWRQWRPASSPRPLWPCLRHSQSSPTSECHTASVPQFWHWYCNECTLFYTILRRGALRKHILKHACVKKDLTTFLNWIKNTRSDIKIQKYSNIQVLFKSLQFNKMVTLLIN